MENYKYAASEGQKLILNFIKNRMIDKGVTETEICKVIGITQIELSSYFTNKTSLPLFIYLQILGMLELRPYIVAKEEDDTIMNRTFFN